MSPHEITERIRRIEELCAGQTRGSVRRRTYNRVSLMAEHHREYFMAMRRARWRLLIRLRTARQRAGLPITANGCLPHYGKPEPSYQVESAN